MTSEGSRRADEAWVTLATNDTYGIGALVLARSLIRVATTRKLVVLVTPGLSDSMRSQLGETFDHVQEVNVLDSSDVVNLALLTRPDLGVTFTKLHCWRLTQFNKCVFMDADTLVMQNCDELFEREELSAAPDVGWPDCFNSGVFVYRPSEDTYAALLRCALTTGSFDGGDQGLLNMYFRDWATKDISKHLPFVYNMTSSVAYFYLPAYIHFGKDVKVVHFIGPVKPWNHHYNTSTGKVDQQSGAFHSIDHLQMWWDIFVQEVQPQLKPDLAGLAMYLSQLSLGASLSPEQRSHEDRARQFAWEQGHIDYMGADSFANIQRKLDDTLTTAAESESKEPESQQAPSESITTSHSSPSSVEPVNVVSCPVAAPTTAVHSSSVHFPDASQIAADQQPQAVGGAVSTPPPAPGISATARMDIMPAIPRTPPILPTTPIMLPPPPEHPQSVPPTPASPDSAPSTAPEVPVSLPAAQTTPSTPSVIPATPCTPPAAAVPAVPTSTESPTVPPVIPSPKPVTPSTPPAGTVIPPTSQPAAPEGVVPPPVPPPKKPASQGTTADKTAAAAAPAPAAAAPAPPLPPRVPSVPAEAAIAPASVHPSQPEAAAAAAAPQPKAQTGGAQKSGAKKSSPTQAQAQAQAASAQGQAVSAPAAPSRKGDKGKPPKK